MLSQVYINTLDLPDVFVSSVHLSNTFDKIVDICKDKFYSLFISLSKSRVQTRHLITLTYTSTHDHPHQPSSLLTDFSQTNMHQPFSSLCFADAMSSCSSSSSSSASSSTKPLQELARFKHNLLEQRALQSSQLPQDPRNLTRTYIGIYLGRNLLVRTWEDGYGLRTCRKVPNSVTPQRRIFNGPIIPLARRFGNWYAESPVVLMGERRQRQRSSPHETPTRVSKRIPWYPGRGPRSRVVDPSATPTRKENQFPKTPRTQKLHLTFRKPATRQQLVTVFFALDTKGNPVRLL